MPHSIHTYLSAYILGTLSSSHCTDHYGHCQFAHWLAQIRGETPFDFNLLGHEVCLVPLDLIGSEQSCFNNEDPHLSAQEVAECCQSLGEDETFNNLYRDDFIQATAKIRRHALCHIELEPYPQALIKWSLKIRSNPDLEGNQSIDQVMEYTSTVRAMILEQVAWVNNHVPDDETFG